MSVRRIDAVCLLNVVLNAVFRVCLVCGLDRHSTSCGLQMTEMIGQELRRWCPALLAASPCAKNLAEAWLAEVP